MPTKRTRRAHHRRASVSPTAWAFLNDQPMPEDHDEWEEFALDYNHNDEAAKLWEVHGDEVTAAWVRERPGTRPRCWWRFSAPRLAEQQPHQFWPDIDSRRHVVSEPPMIESQAAYLRRHSLLTDDERRRLPTTAFEPVPLEEADE